MPVSNSQKKATAKFEKNNYFKTLVRFKKEDEERIRAAAGDSLNGFIVKCVLDVLDGNQHAPQATGTAPDQPKENKADYLPLTVQELKKIDLVALVNDVRYQCDLLKIYGQEQFTKVYQMAKDQECKPKQTAKNDEDIFF